MAKLRDMLTLKDFLKMVNSSIKIYISDHNSTDKYLTPDDITDHSKKVFKIFWVED